MIVFSLRVYVPATCRADFLKSVGALLEPTRVLPGCLGCRFYSDIEKPDAFTLVEEWASQGDLDRHLASCAHKTLIAAIELSTEPPSIHFDTVAQRAGIEVIEAARDAHDRASGHVQTRPDGQLNGTRQNEIGLRGWPKYRSL
jgi:quinol monooxygenase YgiN